MSHHYQGQHQQLGTVSPARPLSTSISAQHSSYRSHYPPAPVDQNSQPSYRYLSHTLSQSHTPQYSSSSSSPARPLSVPAASASDRPSSSSSSYLSSHHPPSQPGSYGTPGHPQTYQQLQAQLEQQHQQQQQQEQQQQQREREQREREREREQREREREREQRERERERERERQQREREQQQLQGQHTQPLYRSNPPSLSSAAAPPLSLSPSTPRHTARSSAAASSLPSSSFAPSSSRSSAASSSSDAVSLCEQFVVAKHPLQGFSGIAQLRQRHGSTRVQVFNVSGGFVYGSKEGGGPAQSFAVEATGAPALEILLALCTAIGTWVAQSKDNVAVVHAEEGADSADIAAGAYLLYSGQAPTAVEASRRIGRARYGGGEARLTHSQRRYLSFFELLLLKSPIRPPPLPAYPALELLFVTTRHLNDVFQPAQHPAPDPCLRVCFGQASAACSPCLSDATATQPSGTFRFHFPTALVLQGDFSVEVLARGHLVASAALHTAFCQGTVVLTASDFDWSDSSPAPLSHSHKPPAPPPALVASRTSVFVTLHLSSKGPRADQTANPPIPSPHPAPSSPESRANVRYPESPRTPGSPSHTGLDSSSLHFTPRPPTGSPSSSPLTPHIPAPSPPVSSGASSLPLSSLQHPPPSSSSASLPADLPPPSSPSAPRYSGALPITSSARPSAFSAASRSSILKAQEEEKEGGSPTEGVPQRVRIRAPEDESRGRGDETPKSARASLSASKEPQVGLGITFYRPDGQAGMVVKRIKPGSAAAAATPTPVGAGDRILAINGVGLEELSTAQLARLVLGKEGSEAKVLVQKAAPDSSVVEVSVTRGNINPGLGESMESEGGGSLSSSMDSSSSVDLERLWRHRQKRLHRHSALVAEKLAEWHSDRSSHLNSLPSNPLGLGRRAVSENLSGLSQQSIGSIREEQREGPPSNAPSPPGSGGRPSPPASGGGNQGGGSDQFDELYARHAALIARAGGSPPASSSFNPSSLSAAAPRPSSLTPSSSSGPGPTGYYQGASHTRAPPSSSSGLPGYGGAAPSGLTPSHPQHPRPHIQPPSSPSSASASRLSSQPATASPSSYRAVGAGGNLYI